MSQPDIEQREITTVCDIRLGAFLRDQARPEITIDLSAVQTTLAALAMHQDESPKESLMPITVWAISRETTLEIATANGLINHGVSPNSIIGGITRINDDDSISVYIDVQSLEEIPGARLNNLPSIQEFTVHEFQHVTDAQDKTALPAEIDYFKNGGTDLIYESPLEIRAYQAQKKASIFPQVISF